MILREVLDSPGRYTFDKQNGHFTVNGKDYTVQFSRRLDGGPGVGLHFMLTSKDGQDQNYNSGVTGTGDELVVFSTVIAMMEEYFGRFRPAAIQFSAQTDEPSRVKLYDRMVARLQNEYNVEINSNDKWEKVYTLSIKQ